MLLNIYINEIDTQSLGGWTFAFYDYYVQNITRYMNSPTFDKLAQMIDPYCMSCAFDFVLIRI